MRPFFSILLVLIGSCISIARAERLPIGGVSEEETCVVDMFGTQCFYLSKGVGSLGSIPLLDEDGAFSVPLVGGIYQGRAVNRTVTVLSGGERTAIRVTMPQTLHELDRDRFLCYSTDGRATTRLCVPADSRRPRTVVACRIVDPDPGEVRNDCPSRGLRLAPCIAIGDGARRTTREQCAFVPILHRGERLPTGRR